MKLFLGILWALYSVQASYGYKLDNPQWNSRELKISASSQNGSSHADLISSHTSKLVPRSRFFRFRDLTTSHAQEMSPGDQEVVRAAFENARLYGIAMLRVQRNDALYTTVFGDPTGEMYETVMQNVRRVVNILGEATEEQLLSPLTADDEVQAPMFIYRASPQPGSAVENAVGWVVGSTINFRSEFWNDLTFPAAIPGIARERDRENPDYIDRIATHNRGAIVFHELIHFVSQQRMQRVIEAAAAAGAQPPTFRTTTSNVVDMRMDGFAARPGTPEAARDGEFLFGIEPSARAYDADLVGRLARLTYGRYAATLNAHSYTMMAVAALLNIPASVFVPRIPNVPQQDGPTHQTSVYTARIEINNSALTDALRERENRSFLAMLLGVEKFLPDSFRNGHDL